MGNYLIIAVCLWIGLSAIVVLALMGAASRRMPSPDSELPHQANVAIGTRRSTPSPMLAVEGKETDPVLDV